MPVDRATRDPADKAAVNAEQFRDLAMQHRVREPADLADRVWFEVSPKIRPRRDPALPHHAPTTRAAKPMGDMDPFAPRNAATPHSITPFSWFPPSQWEP
jgi:hypothetical protein